MYGVDNVTTVRPMTTHQIWYAGTYRRVDSLATKKAGTIDVITLKLCDFENLL